MIYFTISQVPVCLEIPSYTSYIQFILWHILCLIYFLCTIQALIKQEQRSPHSWCHYTNFQKGCSSTLFTPAAWPSGFIICGAPDTSVLKALSTPDTHPLTTLHPYCPVPTQSLDKWNIIIFLYFKSPSYTSPIVLVKKKDGSLHMGVDYRQLNSKTREDPFPTSPYWGDTRFPVWCSLVLNHGYGEWIQPGPSSGKRDEQNCFLYSIWSIRIQLDAFWFI